MIELVDMALLAFMAVVAFTVARLRHLFAAVLVSGFYSLLSAGLFLTLDAVDVAFTEAAVGAGVATVIMLATLLVTGEHEKRTAQHSLAGFLGVLVTGAVLVYGTLDMPRYGDPDAPIHHYTVPRYIEESPREIGVPNIVTSILASYRGYDTLGETSVILTAAVGVLLLLGSSLRRGRQEDGP
ncbi:MAG: DUF4040 domain-containing protein [Gemmatimonadota bacterium]